MNNLEYIDWEEYCQLVKLPYLEKNFQICVLFFRFLKDNGIFKQFKKNYYDANIGFLYRENHVFAKKNKIGLVEFCVCDSWKWLVVDAFEWDTNEHWHSIHKKWIEYAMDKHKNGFI